MRFYLVLLCIACGLSVRAQSSVRIQAVRMAQAFVRADYPTFIRFMYPRVVDAAGGKAKLSQALANAQTELNRRGMSVSNITVGQPSRLYHQGKELQCILPQRTELLATQGHFAITSALIGISDDNGVTWTFLDTSNKRREDILKLLPQLDPGIVIPPASAPELIR